MKTSFFVFFILIGVCLWMLNIHLAYGLLMVPIIVFLFLMLINTDAISYHRMTKNAPILEALYTGDIATFQRYLSRRVYPRTLFSIFLLFATCAYVFFTFKIFPEIIPDIINSTPTTVISSPDEPEEVLAMYNAIGDAIWDAGVALFAALVLFGVFVSLAIFTLISIWTNIKLFRTKTRLHTNPTVEQCLPIAQTVFHLNYTYYCNKRANTSYLDLFSQTPPRYYKVFLTSSTVCAVLIILLGFYISIMSLTSLYDPASLKIAPEVALFLGVPLLYCGISDLISCNSTSGTSRTNIPSSTL